MLFYYRFIRNVENLYTKAIQSSVGGIGLTDVRAAIDEFERQAKQELANEGENSYNNQKGGVRNGEVAEARYSINGEENNSNPTRRDLDNVRGQRQNQVSAIERFQEDSKRARLETKADRLEYLKLLQDGGYTKVSIDYIGTQNFVSYLENFNNKDFKGMEQEYSKIEKVLNNLAPIEKIITQARTIENLHNLIKNNGQDFNLNQEQLALAEKLI